MTDLKEHRDFEKEFEVKTQLKDVRQTGEGVAVSCLHSQPNQHALRGNNYDAALRKLCNGLHTQILQQATF